MAADIERAREWLRRRRIDDTEPSPLLVARLNARRRSVWAELATVAVGTVAFVAWSAIGRFGPKDSDISNLTWLVGLNVTLVLGMLAGFWWRRRAERPLLASRRTRSAHPASPSAAQVLGSGQVAMATVVYGGGALLGLATATLARGSADRNLALAFLAGDVVQALVAGLALVAVLHRPSLAEDSESLLVDDLLRTEDSRRAVVPYPVMVAFGAGVYSGSWLIWPFLAYVGVAVLSWVLAQRAVGCVPTAATVSRP